MSSMEDSGDEGKERRRSIRDKATYWFTLVFTIASLITYFAFSRYTIIESDNVLQEDLTQALVGTAEGVDVSVLLALAENGEKNSEGFSDDARYLALMDWLDQVHRIDPDVWPYLYIESEEAGHIYFVVDLVSIYEPDNSAGFMESYESQSGYILDGLEAPTFRAVKGPLAEFLENLSDTAEENGNESLHTFLFNYSEVLDKSWLSLGRDFGTYPDKYGRWASGYIPLDTPDGEPRAALGMDYKAEMVDKLHDAVRRRLLVSMFLLYGIGLVIIMFFTNMLTQPIIRLQQKARDYGDQGSSAVFVHKKRKIYLDEIDDLEDVLAQMVEKIRLRDQRYEAVVATQSELILRWKPDGTVNFTNPVVNEYFPTLEDHNLYSNEYHYFLPGEEKKIYSLI